MTLPKITSYEIKDSKVGLKIPVVNGVHLHSIYDPKKEAISFVEKNKELLDRSQWIVFLGMGFGYHIIEAHSYLKKKGEDFKILVIEPNNQVYQDCVELSIKDPIDFIPYNGMQIDEIYSDRTLIDALLRKPSIIAHPASFNLYKNYFSEFLTYKSNNTVQELSKIIENKNLLEFFKDYGPQTTLDEILTDSIPNKLILSDDLDHFLLAFKALSEQTITENKEDRS